MTYTEFQAGISSGKIAPIYLFYGTEDFLIEEGIRAIVERSLDPSTKGFNLDVMHGSTADARDVVAHASSFPMMSPRRVVVVKEFEKLVSTDPNKEIVAAYLSRPLESTSLVLVSPEPDFRRKPFNDLKKKAVLIECKPLYDNQIPQWIMTRIRERGRKADIEACRLLQAHVGNSLRAIDNEIEKLLIFIGEKKTIDASDINAVAGASKKYTVFELQNAIGRKDTAEAMRILERMLGAGDSPQMIIVMLTKFFQQLWKLCDEKLRRSPDTEVARELGLSPYFVPEHREFSRRFSAAQIESGFKALLEADEVLKSTSRDPHLVLDLLILSLTGAEERQPVSS